MGFRDASGFAGRYSTAGELAGRYSTAEEIANMVVDLASDLGRLSRPITGQVLFGHQEPASPATTG